MPPVVFYEATFAWLLMNYDQAGDFIVGSYCFHHMKKRLSTVSLQSLFPVKVECGSLPFV